MRKNPLPNYHSARLERPEKSGRYRYGKNDLGDGIDTIFHIPKSGKGSTIQAIRFDASLYTPAHVRAWIKKHDVKPLKIEYATRKNPSIDMKQFRMGVKVEREHTDDDTRAGQIALDHLREDPKYYTHLKAMEDKYVNPGESSMRRKNPDSLYTIRVYESHPAHEKTNYRTIQVSKEEILESGKNVIDYVRKHIASLEMVKQITHITDNGYESLVYDRDLEKYRESRKRVEITWKPGYENYTGYGSRSEGMKARGRISRSTGWIPVYLLILTSRSLGGEPISTKYIKEIRLI